MSNSAIPVLFQSTGPLRDPTPETKLFYNPNIFQSTGPLRDPTCLSSSSGSYKSISIHRSLAGPDRTLARLPAPHRNFNPQVPCGTRRLDFFCKISQSGFQSTGPLRDPTGKIVECGLTQEFQSTGPLRDPTVVSAAGCEQIQFQSTGPLRDPTSCLPSTMTVSPYFNPQVPCGTRRFVEHRLAIHHIFQSTGPLRDPTHPDDGSNRSG